jgi:hypothetical protein
LIFQLAIFDDTGGSENCIGALPIGLWLLKNLCGGFLSHRGTPKSSSNFLLDFPWNKPSSELGVSPWLWKASYIPIN